MAALAYHAGSFDELHTALAEVEYTLNFLFVALCNPLAFSVGS